MTPKSEPHPLRCENRCDHFKRHDILGRYCELDGSRETGTLFMERIARVGCASHTSAPAPDNKGELEYGTILKDGTDWRLRRFDSGMGETEYRIFKNEKFFAQFDNRADADVVMVAMTCPAPAQERMGAAIRELETLKDDIKRNKWPHAYEKDIHTFHRGRFKAFDEAIALLQAQAGRK